MILLRITSGDLRLAARARGHPRGLRSPGPAFRNPGGGATAAAGPKPDAVFPGNVGVAEYAVGAGVAGAVPGPAGGRDGERTVRPDAGGDRRRFPGRRRSPRHRRIRSRSLRRDHRPAADRALAAVADGRGGGADDGDLAAGVMERGRTPPAADGMDRYCHRLVGPGLHRSDLVR